MRFFLTCLAAVSAILILVGLAGCSDNGQTVSQEFRIAFYDPAYPESGQPIEDEFGNWHAGPGHLAFTLYRVAGEGLTPPCDWEIRKGIPDPQSGGEHMVIVELIHEGQSPEHGFGVGTYWVGAYYPGTNNIIASAWLLVSN